MALENETFIMYVCIFFIFQPEKIDQGLSREELQEFDRFNNTDYNEVQMSLKVEKTD